MACGDATDHRSGDTPVPDRRRILVLGAAGYIGQRVVQMLAASDWALPVAVSHRTPLNAAIPVETVRLDARQPAALEEAVRNVAGVVNCITGDSETIIASARALFLACSRVMPALRIVHLSTMMVYGTATGTVDETAALIGDWDEYSAAKTKVEQMAHVCRSVVHLRPDLERPDRALASSAPIGRPGNGRSWILQPRACR
jgi:nucleoside-diphosphate-sugar epimerase